MKAPHASAAGSVDDVDAHRAIAWQLASLGTEFPPKEVTDDLRWQMIAVAAYYPAEQRGFTPGCELEDWVAAEAQLDAWLLSARQ